MIEIICLVFCIILFFVAFPTRIKLINQFFFIFIGIVLILLATFRVPGSDRDYFIYKYFYWGDSFFYAVEYSFILLRSLLKDFFHFPIISIFFIYAFLGVFFKLRAISILSSTVLLSILVYVSNFYLLHELTQIRAGVAVGLFLISTKYIYERDGKKFLFFILLAAFFHYSAFLALPLWFINPTAKHIKNYTILIIIGFILLLLKIDVIVNIPIPYIQEKIQNYIILSEIASDKTEDIQFINPRFLLKLGIFIILVSFHKKIAVHNKYFYILLKIYVISLFAFMALSKIPAFSYRMQSLYGAVDIILIPLMIYIFKNKIVGYLFVIMIAISFLIYNLFIGELIVNP